ncbi:hypothetical protein AAFF_G00385190, partial [Aldrovandia affinis]
MKRANYVIRKLGIHGMIPRAVGSESGRWCVTATACLSPTRRRGKAAVRDHGGNDRERAVITVPACISACLADISAWVSTHHLKLNLGKIE